MKNVKSFMKMVSEKKDFFKSLIYFFLGTVVLRGISFFLIPIYTRQLTKADFGVLELVNTFLNIGSLLLSLGLTQYIGIQYFHYKNEERVKEISGIFYLYIILATPITIMLILAGGLLNKYLFSSQLTSLLVYIMIINTYLQFFVSTYFLLLKNQQKVLKLVLSQIFSALFIFLANLLVVYRTDFGVMGIVAANLLCSIFIIVSAFIFNRFKILIDSYKVDFRYVLKVIRISLPLSLTAILAWIMIGIDRWFLSRYCTVAEVGLYSLAYKFGQLFEVFILTPISTIYSPMVHSRFQRIGIEDTEKKNNYFLLVYIILFPLVTTFGFIAFKPLFKLVVGPEFHSAYKYILMIIYGYIFLGLNYSLTYSLYYTKRTNLLLGMYFIGAIVNIVLNYILVPRYRIWGAAVTTTIAYLVTAIFAFFARRHIIKNLDRPGQK